MPTRWRARTRWPSCPMTARSRAGGPRVGHRQRLPVCGAADPLAVRRRRPQPRPRRGPHPAALVPRRGRPRGRARVARRHPVAGAAGPVRAGVARLGCVDDHARLVDVGPDPGRPGRGAARQTCVDADGAPLDGRGARRHTSNRGRHGPRRRVVGILWDGAHCGDLLHLAEAGELPGGRPADRARAGAAGRRGGGVPERDADQPHLDPHRRRARAGTGCSATCSTTGRPASGSCPTTPTTWHRSAEWLRPGVRTVFEMVNDHVPQGDSPRTASVDEAIDRGADYATMALMRAAGAVRGGAARHGRPAAGPRQLAVRAASRSTSTDAYFRWGVQVDDMGLQQMLQLWEDADDGADPDLVGERRDRRGPPRRRSPLGDGAGLAAAEPTPGSVAFLDHLTGWGYSTR